MLLVSDCAHTTSPQQTDPRICPSSVHLLGHLCVQFCDPHKARWHHLEAAVSSKQCPRSSRVPRSRPPQMVRQHPSLLAAHPDSTHSPSSSSAAHRIINSSPPRLLCDPFPIVPSLTQADPPAQIASAASLSCVFPVHLPPLPSASHTSPASPSRAARRRQEPSEPSAAPD